MIVWFLIIVTDFRYRQITVIVCQKYFWFNILFQTFSELNENITDAIENGVSHFVRYLYFIQKTEQMSSTFLRFFVILGTFYKDELDRNYDLPHPCNMSRPSQHYKKCAFNVCIEHFKTYVTYLTKNHILSMQYHITLRI